MDMSICLIQEGRCLGNSKPVLIIDLDEAKNGNIICSLFIPSFIAGQ
jgi:hypothetical protein